MQQIVVLILPFIFITSFYIDKNNEKVIEKLSEVFNFHVRKTKTLLYKTLLFLNLFPLLSFIFVI